jgi:hypothetical protein
MDQITIKVVTGGFILTYPTFKGEVVGICTEVIVSPRKLNQKLKEVIDSISLVTD